MGRLDWHSLSADSSFNFPYAVRVLTKYIRSGKDFTLSGRSWSASSCSCNLCSQALKTFINLRKSWVWCTITAQKQATSSCKIYREQANDQSSSLNVSFPMINAWDKRTWLPPLRLGLLTSGSKVAWRVCAKCPDDFGAWMAHALRSLRRNCAIACSSGFFAHDESS